MVRIGTRIAACVALAALAVAACGADDGGTGSSAACESAALWVESTTVSRAEELTVRGTAFINGCADSCSVDEDSGRQSCEPSSPRRGITVELVPDGGEPVARTSVDADEEGGFTVTMTVPADATEGRASITADVVGAEPVEVTVVP